MKHNKITYLLLLGVVALLTSSCNDWLTLYPQNKVTEEQFWEDKNDLEGVRYAAYRSFATGGMVERILNWGESRSDNFTHSSYSNSTGYLDYNDMIMGRLDTTCSFFEWNSVYTTINYCNKVLEHGKQVLDRDKQFTESQWNSIKAEMIALRALNYFYLLRAFSDVPIVMHSINTDAQVASTPQSPMIEVLDTIIADVKTVENGYAATNQSSLRDTKSTFTQPAIYALLADMLLWRGSYWEGRDSIDMARADYREAADYAQKSFDELERQNLNSQAGGFTSSMSTKDNGEYNLLQNYSDVNSVSTLNFRAYRDIFNDFYSDESILEMPFTSADKVKDDVLNNYFGLVSSDSKIRFLSAVNDIVQTAYPQCKTWSASSQTWLSSSTTGLQDIRMRYNAAYTSTDLYDLPSSIDGINSNGYIMKYKDLTYSTPEVSSSNSQQTLFIKLTYSTTDYHNFIIYRKSDILLIKAEALACLGEQLDEVEKIIYELRLRSSEYRSGLSLDGIKTKFIANLPSPDPAELKYRDKNAYQHLLAVMHERQLELYAEGKRWFDLVRWAERNQNRYMESPQSAEYHTFQTFFKNTTLRQNAQGRLKSRWALYNPVFWSEREASGYVLKQNPYWDDDLTTN